jgi:hypothetical protein
MTPLTGKAKEAFKAYYFDQYQEGTFRQYEWFKDLPEAFRWGVYQDWADSLGYELYISKEDPLEYFWALCDLLRSFNEGTCKTRQEARNAAVKKLDDLINRQ